MPKKLLCVFMCLALMLLSIASLAEGATTLVGRSVAIPVCQGRDAAQVLTSLEITGLDAPVIGEKLDDEAEVISAEGVRWTIPVLWVNGQGQPIDRAAAGVSPMPVLLFVMQDGCRAALNTNGLADISLSEYLLQVFKSGIVTLAVEAQKVTYITGLNIDLNRLANPAPEATAKSARVASHDEEDEEEPATVWPEPTVEPTPEPTEAPDYVALYASKTARDAVEAEELARVIDILVNNVQPQAVNLLRDRFPAFHEAAEDGGISTQIGLYVYYQRGDGDTTAHWAAGSAQAAVTSSDVEREDGSVGFGSVVIYNLDGLLSVDAEGKLVADTGSDDWKYMESTVVHEFMHAFMSDYNRVGVLGRNDPAFRNLGEVSEDVEYLANWHFQQLMFPDWFREGTATTVANAYTDLKRHFDILKADAAGDDSPAYSRESILTTYANYWDWYGGEFDIKMGTLRGNYPAGYLAVLYLSERAAAGDEALGSSMRTDADGKTVVDSEKLRLGLNGILERLHNGETLDEVIAEVSDGDYADAEDFEARFIKGEQEEGDEASLTFCTTLLNYLEDLSVERGERVSGSILFDFDAADQRAIDSNRRETSDLFNVVGSNDYVESDADNPVPYSDGGYHARGSDMLTTETIREYAAAAAEQERTEKLEGVDWASLEKEEVVRRMLDTSYPSNILSMVEAIEEREDSKSILQEVADGSVTHMRLFWDHDIEYEDYDWDDDWDWDEDDDSSTSQNDEAAPENVSENVEETAEGEQEPAMAKEAEEPAEPSEQSEEGENAAEEKADVDSDNDAAESHSEEASPSEVSDASVDVSEGEAQEP